MMAVLTTPRAVLKVQLAMVKTLHFLLFGPVVLSDGDPQVAGEEGGEGGEGAGGWEDDGECEGVGGQGGWEE